MDDIPAAEFDDHFRNANQDVAEALLALADLVDVPDQNAQAVPDQNAQADLVDVPVQNAQAAPDQNAQAVPAQIPVEVPCAFNNLRHMKKTCSLMGCSLLASLDSYCSTDHRRIAEANSNRSYAFHYFDGFCTEEEQHDRCFVAITKATDGLNVGIPTFDINVLLKPPWLQTGKFFTDLKAHWLFFMKDFKRIPPMHVMRDNIGMAWSRGTTRHLVVSNVPAQKQATVVPYNLQIISTPKEFTKEQEKELSLLKVKVKDWKLYLYRVNDSNDLSLFCVTRVRSDILDPTVKATTVKPQKEEVETDPDAAGGEKKGGNKRKRNDAAGSGSDSVPFSHVPVSQHTYKGVVDSHDHPLNVSREILQENRIDSYSSLTNGKCRKSESLAHLNMKANWFMGYRYEFTAAASDSSSQAPPPAEIFEYQAEVSRLMDLIVNSLYSEVLLRELISNASDALDKLRYLSVTNPELSKDAADLDIRIYADKENGVITLTDSGIGMTRQELVDCLGTISQSGTAKFLKALKDNKDAGGDNNLIGQFGVGFYSVFLVADRVTVSTKSPKSDKQYVWEGQEGSSSYTIKEETDPQLIIPRGTRITLHLKPDDKGFADPERVQKLVKNYSQFVSFPICTWQEKGYTKEVEVDDDPAESKQDNQDDQAEGEVEFRSILYVPPVSRMGKDDVVNQKTKNARLYVKRVFISDDFDGELFPRYLSFIKGVVDSHDLPPNVSREILQESRIARIMKKRLVKKAFDMILGISLSENTDDYEKFWDNFRKHLKLGCIEDRDNHKHIAPLLRFFSSQSENDMISLDEYVENMKAEQKAIYYVASDSITSAKNAPFLEKLLEKELEVLYLVEPIDEVAIKSMKSYKDKDFIDISKEDLDLGDKNEEKEAAAKKEFGQTSDWIKKRLGDKVASVQISSRRSSSPCVLVSGKFGWSANMERLMKAQSSGETTSLEFMKGRRVFEIKPDHSIIKNINAAYKSNPNDEEAMKAIDLMYGAALVSSGFTPENPAELGGKIYEIQPQQHIGTN